MKPDKKSNEKKDILENVALSSAASEVVQRFGSANKEHIVSYVGIDNENNIQLKKSLKSISKSNVHNDYKEQNLKQQSGFAAEVKETARENAERIINKDKTRVTRTDDIGCVNDQLYDHVEIDQHGNVIAGSGSQMKFVGSNPKAALGKLASSKFEKYLNADVKMEVPSDFYDGIKQEAHLKAESLRNQAKELEKMGNSKLAKEKFDEAKKYDKISKNLRKSKVSNKEAMDARNNPELSTLSDIATISHRAGLEQAKTGAVIGGSISIIRNLVDVVQGKKEPKDAAIIVAKDTGVAAVVSYTTAFSGSALKGVMQNSSNDLMRVASKTNLPATLTVAVLETGKILKSYMNGEIDGVECIEELGEKGTGMLSSAMFATIGQVAIPIPIVGAMVGGMIGYALSSACYNELLNSLKEAKIAREDRIRIEKECAEAIIFIKEYQQQMNSLITKYLHEKLSVFNSAFKKMNEAIGINDIDQFIKSSNNITETLGKKPTFDNYEDFNYIMKNKKRIKL